jgi:hypothetical protein
LEKVWAKIHGGYDNIIEGFGSPTLRDLTGAPPYDYRMERENLWEII